MAWKEYVPLLSGSVCITVLLYVLKFRWIATALSRVNLLSKKVFQQKKIRKFSDYVCLFFGDL